MCDRNRQIAGTAQKTVTNMQAIKDPDVPTRDVIADEIMRDIVSGVLNLGQRIPEAEYADRFNVSRTPVREAVLSLSTLGLATVKSRSGSYVLTFTKDSLEDLFTARFHIEASAVRYASPAARDVLRGRLSDLHAQMQRPHATFEDYSRFHDADTLFHRAFVEASGCDRLLSMYEPIEVCALAARCRLDKSRQVTDQASDHHADIIDSLAKNDIDRFEQVLWEHLDWVHAMLKTIFVR